MAVRLLGLLVLALAAVAATQDDERMSPEADAAAESRRSRILEEIEALDGHDWAGEYYFGDGLGANLTLTLAPASGYVYTWHGCLGLYDRNLGDVTWTGDRLQLAFTFENRRDPFGIAPELVVVRWGERRYLVPADDVVGFCNEVNAGAEPRSHGHGLVFLRQGDEQKPVSGRPELPSEYADHLLDEPVVASVASVGASAKRPSKMEWFFVDTALVLDAGHDAGLRPGMKLYVTEPDGLVEWVTITAVEADRAQAVMTYTDDDDRPPQVGWRCSSRPRWRPIRGS